MTVKEIVEENLAWEIKFNFKDSIDDGKVSYRYFLEHLIANDPKLEEHLHKVVSVVPDLNIYPYIYRYFESNFGSPVVPKKELYPDLHYAVCQCLSVKFAVLCINYIKSGGKIIESDNFTQQELLLSTIEKLMHTEVFFKNQNRSDYFFNVYGSFIEHITGKIKESPSLMLKLENEFMNEKNQLRPNTFVIELIEEYGGFLEDPANVSKVFFSTYSKDFNLMLSANMTFICTHYLMYECLPDLEEKSNVINKPTPIPIIEAKIEKQVKNYKPIFLTVFILALLVTLGGLVNGVFLPIWFIISIVFGYFSFKQN